MHEHAPVFKDAAAHQRQEWMQTIALEQGTPSTWDHGANYQLIIVDQSDCRELADDNAAAQNGWIGAALLLSETVGLTDRPSKSRYWPNWRSGDCGRRHIWANRSL